MTADHTPERLSAEEREALLREWIKPTPDPFACYDCLLPYGKAGWCDAHIPDDVWVQISPTGDEGGVLCITCMARRIEALGLDQVPLIVGSGPWLHDPEAARLDGLRQGREQGRADVETRVKALAAGLEKGDRFPDWAFGPYAAQRIRRALHPQDPDQERTSG